MHGYTLLLLLLVGHLFFNSDVQNTDNDSQHNNIKIDLLSTQGGVSQQVEGYFQFYRAELNS